MKVVIHRAWFIASMTGVAATSIIVFWMVFDLPSRGAYPPAASATIQKIIPAQPVTFGLPVRLKIPSRKIDAAIEPVGLTSSGAMDVPKNLANVAWFNRGSRPGEPGSAVIAGHYGWKNGVQAVFDTLHKVHVGDTVMVQDENGMTMTFMVRELRTFRAHEDATNVFTSSDGQAHLNLVTCEGVWNTVKNSYPDRLVVFADKID